MRALCTVTRWLVPRRKLGIPATMRAAAERRRARVPAVARAPLGPLEGTSFSRNGPDCGRYRRRARARLVGSFRALSSRSSSSTSLLTWVARTMIRQSRLFSRATPGSCFFTARGDDLTCAHPLHLRGGADATNILCAIRHACRSFTLPVMLPAHPTSIVIEREF